MRSPKPSTHPQTLESDQGKVVPPHCKARSRHTNAASSSRAPGMSSLASFCFRDREEANFGAVGALANIAMMMKETNPMAVGCQQCQR